METYNNADISSAVLEQIKKVKIDVRAISGDKARELLGQVEGFLDLAKDFKGIPLGQDDTEIFRIDTDFVSDAIQRPPQPVAEEAKEELSKLCPFDFLKFLQTFGLKQLYSEKLRKVMLVIPVDNVKESGYEVSLMVLSGPMLYGRLHGRHVYSALVSNNAKDVHNFEGSLKWNQVLRTRTLSECPADSFTEVKQWLRKGLSYHMISGVSRQVRYSKNQEGQFELSEFVLNAHFGKKKFRVHHQRGKQELTLPGYNMEHYTIYRPRLKVFRWTNPRKFKEQIFTVRYRGKEVEELGTLRTTEEGTFNSREEEDL